MTPDHALSRLRSILAQLPVADLPPRLLNVGCGAYPSALAIRHALPGWTLYGVDLDGQALRCAQNQMQGHAPALRLLQADAIHLPALLRARLGLILIRHPDLRHQRDSWSQIIPTLPALLAPGGVLLITLYAPEEVDLIQSLTLPAPYPLDEHTLAAVDLAGHDRFALAYCAATIE
jgi:SAM-dependent methyltransferase